jgi:hypothetical protein
MPKIITYIIWQWSTWKDDQVRTSPPRPLSAQADTMSNMGWKIGAQWSYQTTSLTSLTRQNYP